MVDILDSFSPAQGIKVDRIERKIEISGALDIFGTAATAAIASTIQGTINSSWTKTFGDGFVIKCAIVARLRPAGGAASALAFPIEVKDLVNAAAPSFVSSDTSGKPIGMILNNLGAAVYTWVVAHEFGHVLRLADRYSESAASQASGMSGGARTTTVQAGYEHNIMGIHLGDLESKNVGDLINQTAKQTGWFMSDVQARTWILSHSKEQIGELSTEGKIKALDLLYDGWISGDDLKAMVAVCGSVTASAEAGAIRRSFKLTGMNDFGQRAKMQIALENMPR
jgi:hypothetical protein